MKSHIHIKDLAHLRSQLRGKTIVLTGGGFDVLHPGHVQQLQWAKKQGDVLVVHITGEKRFIEKKHRKPLFSERNRACIISALKSVDYVFCYNGRHYDQKILTALRPDVLVFNQESFSPSIKKLLSSFSGKILVSTFKKLTAASVLVKQLR